ncbi:unnamed protein product [Lathyrus oleraceus]
MFHLVLSCTRGKDKSGIRVERTYRINVLTVNSLRLLFYELEDLVAGWKKPNAEFSSCYRIQWNSFAGSNYRVEMQEVEEED